MLKKILFEIFERDLNTLKEEINLYADETKIWAASGEIKNSAGSLTLHIIGNLNHFIGAILGKTNYVRDRDAEFLSKGIARDALTRDIENTIEVIKDVLNKLPDESLDAAFPVEMHGKKVETNYALLHLLAHFNYHLGQINYHRRIFS